MLDKLKKTVYEQNLRLADSSLVILTWGNVSARCKDTGHIVIKPSGVAYDKMTYQDMVVVDIQGNVIEGKYKPSSDVLTHIEIYKADDNIMGCAHTHSGMATSFAQAGMPIEVFGTTHADTFFGNVPVTRNLTKAEIENEYEKNTGKVICEYMQTGIPAILVKDHGPFTWGKDCTEAVTNSIILEEVAKLNYQTLMLNKNKTGIDDSLLNKHYKRKHGKDAYYGQD